MPLSACTCCSPLPKCLLKPRIRSATESGLSGVNPKSSIIFDSGAKCVIINSSLGKNGNQRPTRKDPFRSTGYNCRLEMYHLLYGEKARQDANDHNGRRGQGQQLPGREERQLGPS